MNAAVAELKKENFSNVFHEIYKKKNTSKHEIARNLNLSLPTVSQNLEALEEMRLIEKDGYYKSTGGRPAVIYKCNERAKVAVGIELLPRGANIALIDLYGNAYAEKMINLMFSNNMDYYSKLGKEINNFIHSNTSDTSIVLGVDMAIPGIIAEDNEHVSYAEVLKTGNLLLSDFSQHIDYPCGFFHDAEASAAAELWHGEGMNNSIYIILNNFFCSALILNGKIQRSNGLSSGTLEHLVLHEGGRKCYCGKNGCVDAYCSAISLMSRAGTSNLDDFFLDLRNGDGKAVQLWDSYLNDLALAIDNARMVIGCDVVIGGLIQRYITEKDINILKEKILNITTFKNADFTLKKGVFGKKAAMTGAALPRIEKFLSGI